VKALKLRLSRSELGCYRSLLACELYRRVKAAGQVSQLRLDASDSIAGGYPHGRVRRPTMVSEYAAARAQIWDHLRGAVNLVLQLRL